MRIIQSDNPRPLSLLAVGSNGLVAAACSMFPVDIAVEVWDASTGTLLVTRHISELVSCDLGFLPGCERLLMSEYPSCGIYDARTGERKVRVSPELDEFPHFTLSHDGSRLLAAGGPASFTRVSYWSTESASQFRQLWRIDAPRHARLGEERAINPSQDRIAVTLLDVSSDRLRAAIELRSAATGGVLATIPLDPASPVQQLAFSADGTKLLVRTDSRTVQLFDAVTGAPAGELVHPGRPYVTGIAVHPRGPVACARTNGTITLWDAEKREQLRTLDWKAGKLVSVAFSPDGALGAAGTEDGKVIVWDVDL